MPQIGSLTGYSLWGRYLNCSQAHSLMRISSICTSSTYAPLKIGVFRSCASLMGLIPHSRTVALSKIAGWAALGSEFLCRSCSFFSDGLLQALVYHMLSEGQSRRKQVTLISCSTLQLQRLFSHSFMFFLSFLNPFRRRNETHCLACAQILLFIPPLA